MKNFREVIRDIKEGEVWESKNRTIRVKYGNITIENKTGFETKTNVFDENVKYELKQQPVTFEEVLNSNKMCKVEHELIDKSEIYSKMDGFTCDGYALITNLFKSMSTHLSTIGFREVIKSGKWYLEP